MEYRFADLTLDVDRRELRRGPDRVAVEPQVFDLLLHLVDNHDRVVGKDELLDVVWQGRVVSESTLTSRINAARRAIGDSGEAQALLRTIARKGFRFVGDVTRGTANTVQPASAAPRAARPTIAVLPFVNLSGDPEQAYFSEGISEDIITALSKLRWFLVIARNSSLGNNERTATTRQVAEELGVRYLLEGSVRKDGDRVRIAVQLVDALSSSHLWAERYDRRLADVFALQDEITAAVVTAIEPQLYSAENYRAQRKLPDSMDAWDLVMRALSYYWRVTRQDNLVAQALLEKAIAIDPNYGQAMGLLAASHTFSAHMGWEEMESAVAIAERAAHAAIRADSEDPWAHYALGCAYLFTRRFDDSLAEFETAVSLNPNFSLAQGYYGLALAYSGRWQDAIEPADRALRASPRDPCCAIYTSIAAYVRFSGHQYDDAMRLAREAVRMREDFVGAHRVLTAAAAMAGNTELAASALAALERTQPGISLAWLADRIPIRHDDERAHYVDAFRRAGLT